MLKIDSIDDIFEGHESNDKLEQYAFEFDSANTLLLQDFCVLAVRILSAIELHDSSERTL